MLTAKESVAGAPAKKPDEQNAFEKQKSIVEATIKSLISDNPKGTSTLGKLVQLIGKPDEVAKLPKFKDLKGTRAEKQKQLDTARAELLIKNLNPELLTKLDKNEKFNNKKLAQSIRDNEDVLYKATIIKTDKEKILVLKHPDKPLLFNNGGAGVGYVGAVGGYNLGIPQEGFKKDDPEKITLKDEAKKIRQN